MATQRKITPLAMLNKDMFRPTIVGRITKLWTASDPKEKIKFSYDFVLVDQQNTAIEGYININDPNADDILGQIQEGYVYEIYKFKPWPERSSFKTVEHKVRIQLTGATIINRVDNDIASFPIHYFNFRPLSDIGTAIKKEKSVVDVIGHITSTQPLKRIQQSSGAVNILDIEIEDERNDKITVSIWEDCLPQIDFQRIEQQSKSKHVILAFSSLQLNTYGVKWGLKTYSGTRIYQDESMPEIIDFRNRITQKRIQLITNPTTSLQEQLNETAPVSVSIKDLQGLCTPNDQDKLFNIAAEIVDVLDEYGLYYDACPTHKKRLIPPYYYCPKCFTKIEQPLPWLNFYLRVKDNTGEADFVFIGRQAQQLLGSSAQELLTEQTDDKKQHLPPKFLELRNKKMLFTVHWGKNKFKSNSINYQAIKTAPIPATTQTSTATAIQLQATPPEEHHKNSSDQEPKAATTPDKRTAKQLFIEQPSKKLQTSTESSKGKDKVE